ncbi:MAG: hypothetical protein AAGH15_28475 [Myxococcota bacterium]
MLVALTTMRALACPALLLVACSSTSVAFTDADGGVMTLDAGPPPSAETRIATALEELVPARRDQAAKVYTCAGLDDFSMALMNIERSTRDIVGCTGLAVAENAALTEELAELMECYAEGMEAVVACIEPAECGSDDYDACRNENYCLYPACEATISATLLETLRGCSDPEIIGRPGGGTSRSCE